jgi:MscS family membrane protein
VTLLLSGAIAVRYMLWGVRRDARVREATRRYGQPAAAAVATVVFAAATLFIVFGLKIWGEALAFILTVLQLMLILTVGWFAMVSVRRLADIVIGARGLRGTSIDGHLIKVVATLLSIGLGLYLFFTAADLVGIPVAPLLAGLGIGGLAIALAVRPTLENVIGGLTLFADGPARVGDVCRFGVEMGTIEEIGLRTTKVRKMDDALLSVPNAELAQVRIENMSRRRKFLYNPRLGLRYETTADQLRQVSDGIMALLTRHQKVLDDGFRVRLAGFGDYAINLDVFAYVDVTRMPDFLIVQEELNLAVMAIVKQAGTGFAFPSQTNYIARDSFP